MTDYAPVHYSNLRRMALSPAHYQASLVQPHEPTRAMRIGTIVHHIALGPRADRPLVCFSGDARRGKDWERFLALHQGGYEIVTQPEWDEAEPMADAVKRDPVARKLLEGARFELPAKWVDAGIERETHGIDIVGPGYIAELKTTTCTEPAAWARHATKLLYHCQMADYDEAARQNGLQTTKGQFIIGVESAPPYAVTVLKLTAATLAQGRKSIAIWTEKLRTCRENDSWPAYTQTALDYELPPWMGEGIEEETDAP